MSPSTARQTFREIVAEVAAMAKAKLPTAVNGRIEAAVKLVLAGDVAPQEDGTITVGSSDPTRYYRLTGQACTCTDFSQGKAPEGWCKHRIAAGIQKRVRELIPESAPGGVGCTDPAPLPEAPASANVRLTIDGRDVQLTLRDTGEGRLLQRLQAVLAQYPLPQPAPQAATQPQGQGKDWCSKHQTAMKQTTKDGRTWWSHRTADGWCKGK
jgi:hypothetical protein